jgi:hypothetical protein
MLTSVLAAVVAVHAAAVPCAAPQSAFEQAEVIGIATTKAGGDPIYCEYHRHLSASEVRVEYYSPQGKVFAEKLLRYEHDSEAPEMVQTDQRSGEMHEVKRNRSSWLLSYRESSSAQRKQTELSAEDVDVVDAGFDNAVRKYWTAIHANQKVVIRFASTVFQRSLSLRIRQKAADQCPFVEAHTEQGRTSCIWVEAANALVRAFVDPLQLVYNDKQQLLLFHGVVNIQSDRGKKQSAEIRYYYPTKRS